MSCCKQMYICTFQCIFIVFSYLFVFSFIFLNLQDECCLKVQWGKENGTWMLHDHLRSEIYEILNFRVWDSGFISSSKHICPATFEEMRILRSALSISFRTSGATCASLVRIKDDTIRSEKRRMYETSWMEEGRDTEQRAKYVIM